MPAALVFRAVSIAARPVLRLGGRAIRFVRGRPVTVAATVATGAVATGVADNPIEDIADATTSGAVKFIVGAGLIWGGYKIVTNKKVRSRIKRVF